MTQYFDDIQVSDKGMVKLIRNEGKDYIFPGHLIYSISPECNIRPTVVISDTPVVIDEKSSRSIFETSNTAQLKRRHGGVISSIIDVAGVALCASLDIPVESEQKEQPSTITIIMNDGQEMVVETSSPLHYASRLQEARDYSNALRKEKYGVFS